MLGGEPLDANQNASVRVIRGCGETLLAILNDVLDLSKIEAGKLELETIEFDLGEVAQGAYSAFTALANKKGLAFALDMGSARGRYLGDPDRSKADRTKQAMMKMGKIIIADLDRAYAG